MYILPAGGAHLTISESNSPMITASENFRDESCTFALQCLRRKDDFYM